MKHGAIAVAAALTAAFSIGCASPPPMQEKFGQSTAALKAAQIGTSDSRQSDLSGLDGRAAQMVMRGYLRAYDRARRRNRLSAAAAFGDEGGDRRRNAFIAGRHASVIGPCDTAWPRAGACHTRQPWPGGPWKQSVVHLEVAIDACLVSPADTSPGMRGRIQGCHAAVCRSLCIASPRL